jgi:hypothetical protein
VKRLKVQRQLTERLAQAKIEAPREKRVRILHPNPPRDLRGAQSTDPLNLTGENDMGKIIIETEGQPTTVVVDGHEANFGASEGGGVPPSAVMPPVQNMPPSYGDVGTGGEIASIGQIGRGQEVGIDFEVVDGTTNERVLRVEGNFYTDMSWAIFDSGGGRITGMERQPPQGSMQYDIGTEVLKGFGPGKYRVAYSFNNSGSPKFHWRQN